MKKTMLDEIRNEIIKMVNNTYDVHVLTLIRDMIRNITKD